MTGLVVQPMRDAFWRLLPAEKLAFAVVLPGSLTMPIQLKVFSEFVGGMALRPSLGPLPFV